MSFSALSNFTQRLIVSLILATIVTIAIIFAHHPFARLLFAFGVISLTLFSLIEFYQLARAKNYQPLQSLGLIGSFIYLLMAYQSTQLSSPSGSMLLSACLFGILILGFAYYFIQGENPLINLALTFFGFTYLTIPLSCLFFIVYFFPDTAKQDGRGWIAYLLIVSKLTDTGGYIIGKKYGKSLLTPYISPKKTWEGAFGGLLAALLGSLIIKLVADLFTMGFHLSLWQSLWFGLTVGLLAQFGDLCESLLKRDSKIKDSNPSLPGLGGVLDMMDSLVFTTPYLYFLIFYFVPNS